MTEKFVRYGPDVEHNDGEMDLARLVGEINEHHGE